jgi:hypothetical protein
MDNKIIHLSNHDAPVQAALIVLKNPITELHGKIGEIDQVIECLDDRFFMFFKQLQEFLQVMGPGIFDSDNRQLCL